MNKADLVEHVAAEMGVPKAEASRAVKAVLGSIQEGIIAEGVANIAGFGKFEIRERKARMGRNPKTGEPVEIAASKSVGFKVSTSIKKLL